MVSATGLQPDISGAFYDSVCPVYHLADCGSNRAELYVF